MVSGMGSHLTTTNLYTFRRTTTAFSCTILQHSTIQGFRFVFEFYIRYYPQKKGLHLLFSKNNINQHETAFELACNKHPLQHDKLRSFVETTLDNSNQPLNIVDALVTAAISERIHLDCVYTIFRRHPVAVVNALLLGPPNNNNNNNELE